MVVLIESDYLTEHEMLEKIYHTAASCCYGIYIRSDTHPCGWDFLSFVDMENPSDMWEMEVEVYMISDGCYNNHEWAGMTVEQILRQVGNDWSYEKENICW